MIDTGSPPKSFRVIPHLERMMNALMQMRKLDLAQLQTPFDGK